jgi:hypothetical protein
MASKLSQDAQLLQMVNHECARLQAELDNCRIDILDVFELFYHWDFTSLQNIEFDNEICCCTNMVSCENLPYLSLDLDDIAASDLQMLNAQDN